MRHTWMAVLFFIPVMLWGAMTAGLDAGLVYGDEFPTMGGRIIPSEISQTSDIINRPAGVQFMHRWLAIGFVMMLFSVWLHGFKRGIHHWALNGLGVMAIVQLMLGIATIYSGVNIYIATLHQIGALVIVGLLVVFLRRAW